MSSSARPGQLLILSAPSGAGKTTLARRILAEEPDAVFSVSVTTRAPRGREQDGVDYHFVTRARFDELVALDAFAEWAEVHGQRYGTLKSTVDEALRGGKVAVFDIDVQGGGAIQSRWPRDATTIFVLPPSLRELERRLRARSTDADDVIRRRLAAARAEIERGATTYDFVIVNDDLEEAFARIRAIARGRRAALAGAPDRAAEAEAEKWRSGRIDVAAWLANA